MDVPQDFAEFGALLNANEVRYLIVGAFAFGYHVRPRATKDIDFWVEPSVDNAGRTLAAIRAFGFKTLDVTVEELARPGLVLILGVAPKRIDVITSIAGVRFSTAWRNRGRGLLREVPVWFLGRAELIRNKRAVGRPQDLADLDILARTARLKPRKK